MIFSNEPVAIKGWLGSERKPIRFENCRRKAKLPMFGTIGSKCFSLWCFFLRQDKEGNPITHFPPKERDKYIKTIKIRILIRFFYLKEPLS
jgi:hypothetical protein